MLVMEAAFGVPGLVAAPIYYAYMKQELVSEKLIRASEIGNLQSGNRQWQSHR